MEMQVYPAGSRRVFHVSRRRKRFQWRKSAISEITSCTKGRSITHKTRGGIADYPGVDTGVSHSA